MKSLRLFALTPLALLSISAHAADVTGKDYFYLGTGTVGVSTDPITFSNGATLKLNDSQLTETPNVLIGAGHYYSKHYAVEGYYRYSGTENDQATNSNTINATLDTHQLGVSALATTGPLGNSPFELYAKLSGTYTYAKLDSAVDLGLSDDKDSTLGLNLSGGVQWNIMKSDFFFRAEYVYALTMGELFDYDDYDYKGVQISLGRTF